MFEGTDIQKIVRGLALLKASDIFVTIMRQNEAQSEAVRLNTSQMKDQFINSQGQLLADIGGAYSPYTMSKGKKKSPTSVDLYDTGEFHKSFKVQNVTSSGFDIVSDSIKDDGTDLKVEWGKEIEGLTQENQIELANFILDLFFEDFVNYMKAA